MLSRATLVFFLAFLAAIARAETPPAYIAYAGQVQGAIMKSMALNNAPEGWMGLVKVWVDAEGRVTKVKLDKATGPLGEAGELQRQLARTILPAPPTGLPMPIALRVSARPKSAPPLPPGVAEYLRVLEKQIVSGLRQMPDIPIVVDGTAQLWIDATGKVTKAELVRLNGLTINDGEVKQQLARLQFPAPPAGTPMPVSTHLKMEPKR